MAFAGLNSSLRWGKIASLFFVAAFAGGMFSQIVGASDDEEINWKKEQEFWSFRRPVMPQLPQVSNQRWPQQRLDYFVLGRMESKGLTPSPRADKQALIRRLTYDLTGLPPTPAEIDAFLKDKRADAYEKVVGRLLGSPIFGERM